MGKQRAYLDAHLDRIERTLIETVTKHDYPADTDALSLDETWSRLQEAIRESENPSGVGVRVRRAYAGLLRLREVRQSLDRIDDDRYAAHAARAVRHALRLGLHAGEALTHSEQLQWQRRKGAVAGGAQRSRQTAAARRTIRKAAAEIDARRRRAGDVPLSRPAMARRLSRQFPEHPERTILQYLAGTNP